MINNPVLRKELLLRFRIRQPTPTRIGIGIAIGLLVIWTYWYGIQWLFSDTSPSTGHDAWCMTFGLQYLIIFLVAPSLTANAITQEKEQQTWEMLIFTRLLPGEIVLGKLMARLVSVVLIMAVFLPFMIFSWARAAEGSIGSSSYISIGQFLAAYLVLGVSAVCFATIGLFLSLLLKRTLYAIIVSYVIVVGFLCIGTALLAGAISSITGDGNLMERSPLMWFNPFRLMAAPIGPTEPGSTAALLGGLLGYTLATTLMLTFMITRFRRYAEE